MLTDPWPLMPFVKPVRGQLRLPGSKSITNRAMILAALSTGTVRLEGALFSRDTQILCGALADLGFELEVDPVARRIRVEGLGGAIPRAKGKFNIGNAGTAARFLTAFLSLHPGGEYFLDGDPEMRLRPMAGLLDALGTQGVVFDFHGVAGHFPFTMRTSGIRGGRLAVDARASSQILSALLMVAPLAREPLELEAPGVRPAFVEMTVRMMAQFGVDAGPEAGRRGGICGSGQYSPAGGHYLVEPDVTAASYFLALVQLVGGELLLSGMPRNSLQGDVCFVKVMEDLGLGVDFTDDGWKLRSGPWRDAPERIDFESFSDTFMSYAVLAPFLQREIEISGIGHTRWQETDRVEAIRMELERLGQLVTATRGGLRIRPSLEGMKSVHAGGRPVIQTYHDHRIAMSFGVLGSLDLFGTGQSWLAIREPSCCGKTFPEFFEVLEKLRAGSQ